MACEPSREHTGQQQPGATTSNWFDLTHKTQGQPTIRTHDKVVEWLRRKDGFFHWKASESDTPTVYADANLAERRATRQSTSGGAVLRAPTS